MGCAIGSLGAEALTNKFFDFKTLIARCRLGILCEIDSFDVRRPQEVELIVLLKWLVLSFSASTACFGGGNSGAAGGKSGAD